MRIFITLCTLSLSLDLCSGAAIAGSLPEILRLADCSDYPVVSNTGGLPVCFIQSTGTYIAINREVYDALKEIDRKEKTKH